MDVVLPNGCEGRSQVGEKSRGPVSAQVPDRRETGTSRAEQWVALRVREKPGHVTRASLLYSAYRAWAQQRDPDGSLSYTAFQRVVEQGAPIERIVRLRTERGRPQLAFEGIVLGHAPAAAKLRPTSGV